MKSSPERADERLLDRKVPQRSPRKGELVDTPERNHDRNRAPAFIQAADDGLGHVENLFAPELEMGDGRVHVDVLTGEPLVASPSVR